jgi:hypothetical protein
VIGTYRDDALTGKKLLRRPGLQLMLNDIKSGRKKPDLILIDNFERFGRIEEMESLSRSLFRKFGILILTADTRFADPTTQHGKVYRTFESFRATSANELKSSEVFSGKRLLIEEKKFWPGGEAPFGFRLQPVMGEKKGRSCVVGHLLVPEPEAFPVAKKVFDYALSTGCGAKRATRMVNADPTVPDKFKPLNAVNVGYMLKNEIYAGILIWGEKSFDIIDDVRVSQRNPEEEWVRMENFCESAVSVEDFKTIQARRLARARALKEAQAARANQKLIPAITPGLALVYPMTGLVRCGTCGRAMRPSTSPAYTLKSTGETRKYVKYVCPGFVDGEVCPNSVRVPEPWLREIVANLIRLRLFSSP